MFVILYYILNKGCGDPSLGLPFLVRLIAKGDFNVNESIHVGNRTDLR